MKPIGKSNDCPAMTAPKDVGANLNRLVLHELLESGLGLVVFAALLSARHGADYITIDMTMSISSCQKVERW